MIQIHREGSLLHFFLFLLGIPFLFILLVPILYKLFNPRVHIGWFVLAAPVILFVHLFRFLPEVRSGSVPVFTVPWIPSLGMNLTATVDGLSLLFGLLITGMGALVILYSVYYMSKTRDALHNFYVYLLLFMGAMLGVVFSDHLLVLYVFWELTSIASFLLIAFWYERKTSRAGALKALLITVSGGFSMLAGFIILGMISGTASIREIIAQAGELRGDPLFVPAMVLILIGAFAKSAQFPFSIWLPDAMEAPTPISAYLHSATMVKAGLYLVARLTPVFGGTALWFWLVSGAGIVTLLYGSITAVKQADLKALLAYSTVSQLGLIMSLLGIGSLAWLYENEALASAFAVAMFAGIFHLFNHSVFKGSLFMTVGIIDHETGTRDIRRLGGLINVMPVTFTVALIGAFSMAGLPPFGGFLSKEMFFEGTLKTSAVADFGLDAFGAVFPAFALAASVFTFVYCMIFVFKTFAGKYRPETFKRKIREAPPGMLIPALLLAAVTVLVFFFPDVPAEWILRPAALAAVPASVGRFGEISAWHGFSPPLLMTAGVVLAGVLLYRTLEKWSPLYRHYPQKFTLNAIYVWMLEQYESLSRTLTDRYMTGSARHYLMYIFLFFILGVGGFLLASGGLGADLANDAPIGLFDAVVVVSIILAALTAAMTNNRITAIVALSVAGYMVVILFVIFRAPDLALTQMVVETVTTVLFLLCFYHLPQLEKRMEKTKFKLTNFFTAAGVGLVVTLFTLAAFDHKLFKPITAFFENSYELAGAKNIVNAIIVDFRGFDTLLEISVLTAAGLGVYTLVRLGMKGRDADETE